jgi:hypothetical protein
MLVNFAPAYWPPPLGGVAIPKAGGAFSDSAQYPVEITFDLSCEAPPLEGFFSKKGDHE